MKIIELELIGFINCDFTEITITWNSSYFE